MPTAVTTSESGPVHVVHVAGEIDVTSAAVLRDALEALIADGHRCLTLDLTDVTRMSTVAAYLLNQLAADTGYGVRVVVQDPSHLCATTTVSAP